MAISDVYTGDVEISNPIVHPTKNRAVRKSAPDVVKQFHVMARTHTTDA